MVGPIEKAGGVSVHTVELSKELRKLGVNVEVYNISPNREYPRWVSNLIKLYKRTLGLSMKLLLDGRRFDVIHIQASGPMGGFLPAVVGAFWKKILGFKMLITFHYGHSKTFLRKYRLFFKFTLSTADMFFVVSQKQWEDISEILGNHNTQKIRIMPNGFDQKIFYPQDKTICRKQLGLPQDKKIILNVASLVSVKGHEYLIEAINEFVKYRKDVMCIIIGDGVIRRKLEDQIKNLHLGYYVKLVGAKPHNEIPLWMNAADIFVLPSLSEGNPTVMFEALGVGLPFVGTTVGGVPEIITSEDYGLLCPPADPECLAEKILIALEKDWDREKIMRYAGQFTWKKVAKEVVDIYDLIISRRD